MRSAVPTPSLLDPAGPIAGALADISWALIIGAFVIASGVTVIGVRALLRPQRRVPVRAWILGGGIVFPLVVLSALFILGIAHSTGPARSAAAADISVTASMWWWEIRYRDPDAPDGRRIVAANELWIPVGRPVRVALATNDVIHSFWVPQLAGKVDMVPGRVTHLTLEAGREGIFRGQCAEFCGTAHARMALHVVAVSPERFAAWRAAQAAPAAFAQDATAQRGRALFVSAGCAGCHTIRGVAQSANRGPDLTHVASRNWLAAGTLPNGGAAALRQWLVETQHLKPGARMPAFDHLAASELDALAAFLAQLH